MHVWEDHFIAEIVDPQTGEPVAEGEYGELVLTTLRREAMPILRYRTRDITAFIPGECAVSGAIIVGCSGSPGAPMTCSWCAASISIRSRSSRS